MGYAVALALMLASSTMETPNMAVVMAAAPYAAVDAQIRIPSGTFASLPPPQQGMSYSAEVVLEQPNALLKMRVFALWEGRVVASTLRIFSWARRNETVEPKVFGRRLHTKNHTKVKATPQGAQYRQTSDEKADTVVRSLMAEKPTQDERDLRRRYLVKRGDTVRVKLQVGSLEVSLTGRALTNAARGESVRIRNERNRRVVDAVVTESGEAVVLDL